MNISFFLQPKCKVAYIYNNDTLRQGLQKMNYYGYSAIPVLDEEERYVGTITEGDFLWHICRINQNNGLSIDVKELEKKKVHELYFRRNYPSVKVDTSMEELFEKITNQNFVPVTDDRGIFIGIITRKDIITYLSAKKKEPKCKMSTYNTKQLTISFHTFILISI